MHRQVVGSKLLACACRSSHRSERPDCEREEKTKPKGPKFTGQNFVLNVSRQNLRQQQLTEPNLAPKTTEEKTKNSISPSRKAD